MRRGFTRLRRAFGDLPKAILVAFLVALVVAAAGAPVVALVLHDDVPVWGMLLGVAIAASAGILYGAWGDAPRAPALSVDRLRTLEGEIAALRVYDTYAVHVEDALRDLRHVVAGELPSFSLRDFIEIGIFEPAHQMLQHDRGALRGDVRFSIIHPGVDETHFVMANDGGLFPARGHRLESRQRFRLRIDGWIARRHRVPFRERPSVQPPECGRTVFSPSGRARGPLLRVDGVRAALSRRRRGRRAQRPGDQSECVLGCRPDVYNASGGGD